MVVSNLRQRPARGRGNSKPAKNRAARKPVSYREDSSDSENDSDAYVESQSSSSRRNYAPPPTISPPSNSRRKRKAAGPGRKRHFAGAKKAKTLPVAQLKEKHDDTSIHFTGKPMPWQTLPYHIWASIFDFASRPLIDDTFQPTPSIAWLVQASLCCKAFAEPAFSTLYYSPPLYSPDRAHAFVKHLRSLTEDATINYGAKIKYLEVEAIGTLLRKHAGQEPVDIGEMVMFTPQLRGIDLQLLSDNPKWRRRPWPKAPANRAAYQPSLFAALQERKVFLQDWSWNQFIARDLSLSQMREIHKTPPFQSLRNLCIINYEASPEKEREGVRPREDMLADAINNLPNLTNLSFRTSSVVNKRLLSSLPNNLHTLAIVESPLLSSSSLKDFLIANGGSMRELILDHNQSLNLSFLVHLATACPSLEVLKMNLRYFNTYYCFHDADPKYTALLFANETPDWPANLRILELYHLRKWSLGTAERFFSSLTDAAGTMQHLRQLKIKASLDESGWRDRVAFRDKWTQRLQHVFLRRSVPPNAYLSSIASFKAFKAQHKKAHAVDSKVIAPTTRSTIDRKKSVQLSHVEIPQTLSTDARKIESDSDSPLVKVRRSTRAKTLKDDICLSSEGSRHRRKHRRASDDSSSEDSAIDDDGLETPVPKGMEDGTAGLHVQGLCDVVDVLIDNLRPSEEHLKEDDFLDDELSGDEDWNGDDDIPGDGRYAW